MARRPLQASPEPTSFGITAEWRTETVTDMLRSLAASQVPFATALALTKTGQAVKTAEIAEMKSVFDRPTPYTLNALRLQTATKRRQEARVWFREGAFSKGTSAQDYLGPQVFSGQRKAKRLEKLLRMKGMLRPDRMLVPGKAARLDSYGNMSRGQIQQILSGLGAQSDRQQNETARSRKRAASKGRGQFFASVGGNELPDGVYQRRGDSVRPMLIAIKPPIYKKRFAFFEVAQKTTDAVLPGAYLSAFEMAMRTAR